MCGGTHWIMQTIHTLIQLIWSLENDMWTPTTIPEGTLPWIFQSWSGANVRSMCLVHQGDLAAHALVCHAPNYFPARELPVCGVNMGIYAINQIDLVKGRTHSTLWYYQPEHTQTIHNMNTVWSWDTLFAISPCCKCQGFFLSTPRVAPWSLSVAVMSSWVSTI